jgi:hypothetical protein
MEETEEEGAAVGVTANMKRRMGKGADIRDGSWGSELYIYLCFAVGYIGLRSWKKIQEMGLGWLVGRT